jgi:glutamate-ammonia-ligase adenylyltransferase
MSDENSLEELSTNHCAPLKHRSDTESRLDPASPSPSGFVSDFRLRPAGEALSPARSDDEILQRIAADAPEMYRAATRPELSPAARASLFRFLNSAFASSERYQILLRHSSWLAQGLILFESSRYLTDILIRHPEEFATLGGLTGTASPARSGYLFESPLAEWKVVQDPVLAYIVSTRASHAEKLEMLRRHFRHRAFSEGSRDVLESRDVYASLAAISAAAGDAIDTAFKMAGEPEGLSILALGRLGTQEFDVLSDADLLLVRDEDGDAGAATRLAEQVVQTLAAYTVEGTVFTVDLRLRPRGSEGELVITPSQLKAYLMQDADPWEALVYTKLRQVAGSRRIAERVVTSAESLFQRYANAETFLPRIRVMRAKLESISGLDRNFTTGTGGIYDIDFLTAYLLVKHGIRIKSGTLRDRLWRCCAFGVLAGPDAAALDHAAELFRTVEHVLRLATGQKLKWLPAEEHGRETAGKLSSQILSRTFPLGLEHELREAMEKVHEIYKRTLAV